ncbi:alpha-galactosidase [Tropicimonas sp. TH_r6]|uniref:family 4 glycosyl hydrolase n=1 Tax=Tropicimonas sp. TH_r6 TaxID=3082085 RepID=UPI002955D5CB|nr:alpha-galactosidase [Tropicimonas sp. TH_r6]MDV7144840.1 alpha-galactosidase [Tropicimonas sp. TH_r6]
MHVSGLDNKSTSPAPRADLTIAYVGGGSLNWAPTLMADLAAHGGLSGEVRLYDIDIPAAERNARLGNRFATETGATMAYRAEPDLRLALKGADVVVISILPGPFEAMSADIDIPRRHGIIQSVGDTVGPGGFVRALRAIPMVAEIAAAIGEHAPDAFVCNLTNPMSALTGTLYAVHPGIRAWGECHEVTKLRAIAAWLGNRRHPGAGYTYRDVQVNVLGINHFTFVDAISLHGTDLLPDYREMATTHMLAGWRDTPIDPADEKQRLFEDFNRVKFDLLRHFGVAAAAGDRHLAEFLPQEVYLTTSDQWGFELTPVDFRIREKAQREILLADWASGKGTLPQITRSSEALIDQIEGLMTGKPHVSNANLPNHGQLAGLPLGTIVETNALFSGLGIQPIHSGRLPEALTRITADHALRQTALVEAVLGDQTDALFPLFASEPALRALGEDAKHAMFKDMLSATARWLPETLKAEAA